MSEPMCRKCASLVQAVVILLILVLLAVFIRPIVGQRAPSVAVTIVINVVGVGIGLQAAVVYFRWQLTRKDSAAHGDREDD